jgi:FkbM family methyltransferase
LKAIFLNLTNWYARRMSFPKRGLKYFMSLVEFLQITNRDFQKKTKNGVFFSLDIRDHIQRQIFWYGYYERQYTQFLLGLLQPGDVFVDVGGNIGYYTLMAASIVRRPGKVYCFEPSLASFQRIQKNVSINGFDNITLSRLALSNSKGEASLYLSSNDNSGTSGLSKASNYSGIDERIDTTTMDEFIKTYAIDRVDVVKIDIEGHELEALEGMSDLIDRFKPLFMIEICKGLLLRFNRSPGQVYRFLKTRGYLPFHLNSIPALKEIQTEDLEGDLIIFIHQNDDRFAQLTQTTCEPSLTGEKI